MEEIKQQSETREEDIKECTGMFSGEYENNQTARSQESGDKGDSQNIDEIGRQNIKGGKFNFMGLDESILIPMPILPKGSAYQDGQEIPKSVNYLLK